MNSPTIITPDNHIEIDLNTRQRQISFSTQRNEDQNQPNLPLLLQPSYARSKFSIFDELQRFRLSLKWTALDHSSCKGKFISYFIFIFLTIIVPLLTALSVRVPAFASDEDPVSFDKMVQIPESGLATISFFILSRFFKRYRLCQLLFLDDLEDDSLYVRHRYTQELDRAFRCLAFILFPSFIAELVHKIIFFSIVKISMPYVSPRVPLNLIVFVLGLTSWVYRTGVFLLVCALFRLTCELQILRFEGLHKRFEGCDSDSRLIFLDHTRIKKQLSVTSHRYRFFIIGCMVTVTVSQFVTLLLVLASKIQITFFNSGDLVVCSAVELSGIFLCLMGAARITHRAQGIVSIATSWNMLVTCASARLDQWKDHSTTEPTEPTERCAAESDSNFSDNMISVSSQDPSSFQTRQALVAYLQHNNGGITLFGFALDRGLLQTLFAFEFSLVLWILSQVVVLS